MTAESNACPYCGFVASDTDAEVAHMKAHHPEIITQRLLSAGFYLDPQTGEWIDSRASDED